VEEFIQGENLKQYIGRRGSISASLLLEISIQLCEILIFLHHPARNILHLDIKPENILFENHKMKLIDFGSAICRNLQNEELFIFGTPAYCAPEMKGTGILSEKTDIYCMGKCMEYLLLHTPKAPKGYRNIVHMCLRKADKEYETAEQVLKDLKRLLRKKTVEKQREIWFAVTGVTSEQESSMAALQLAMYLRDRYKKPVLYLDCTEGRWMEHLEHSKNRKETLRGQQGFVFERESVTVAKRVAPQEVNGWRDRGYSLVVSCFGINAPLAPEGGFHACLLAGAITEFNLTQWKTMLLSLDRVENLAVALTGGDFRLAKCLLGRRCRIGRLPMYFEAFGQSKPFRRQMKQLLGKL
jgi:serine/threonine protein kinase